MRSSWPTRRSGSQVTMETTMAEPAEAPRQPSPRRRAAVRPTQPGGVAFIEPRVLPIEKATDLGSVQVLKHGNLYLLTDPFGDIRPDSRGLGLYLSDTRLLSCCSLRIGGIRPVLLQGSMGANYRGSIQLTNPSADRNPDAKMHTDWEEVAGRTLGIARDRLIGIGGLEGGIRIGNHARKEAIGPIELQLGAGGARNFAGRGSPPPHA